MKKVGKDGSFLDAQFSSNANQRMSYRTGGLPLPHMRNWRVGTASYKRND